MQSIIKLGEQSLEFDEDIICSEGGDPPFSLSYYARYGDDQPFINKLVKKFDYFEDAWHEWSVFIFTEDTLSYISEVLVNTYPPSYDQPLAIDLLLLDNNDCVIASSSYDCSIA